MFPHHIGEILWEIKGEVLWEILGGLFARNFPHIGKPAKEKTATFGTESQIQPYFQSTKT